MHSGPEQLRDWIERRGLNQRKAADFLGMNETFMHKLLKGIRTPGRRNSLKIERLTGVTVEAWESSPVDSSDAALKRNRRKPLQTKRQVAHV